MLFVDLSLIVHWFYTNVNVDLQKQFRGTILAARSYREVNLVSHMIESPYDSR
jgi:hypothetical protein